MMWEVEERVSKVQEWVRQRDRRQCGGGITGTRFSRWGVVVRLPRQLSGARWNISHGWPGHVPHTLTLYTFYFVGLKEKSIEILPNKSEQ